MPKVQDALLIDYGEGAAFSPDGERDAAAMLRALRRVGQEPALFVVIAEGAGRTEFLRRFDVWQRLQDVPRVSEIGEGAEGVRRLDLKLRGHGGQHAGMLVPDADLLAHFQGGRVLDGLNIARDGLERVARGPLVLVFSPEGARLFAERAPDLFDGRTMTAVFDVVSRPPSPHLLGIARAAPQTKALPQAIEAQIRAEMIGPEVLPTGLAIDYLLTVAQDYYDWGDSAACYRIASECLGLSRMEEYAEGIGRSLALRVKCDIGRHPAPVLEAQLAEAMILAREHQLDRLLMLVGSVAGQLAFADDRPLDALRLAESVVLPSAESVGDHQVSLSVRGFVALLRLRTRVHPPVSPQELRTLLRSMSEARLAPGAIRGIQFVLASVLARQGTHAGLREAHALLSQIVPTLTPEIRAEWQPLYAEVRERLGNESPVGPNRAARRAKLRQR